MNMMVIGSACQASRAATNGEAAECWLGSAQATGAGMLPLIGLDDEVYLVARVGNDALVDYRHHVQEQWLGRLNTDYVLVDPRGANHAVVKKDSGRFSVQYRYRPNSITRDEISVDVLRKCSAVILNAGCAFNFDPEIVPWLREAFQELFVYVDVHCLLWTVDEQMRAQYTSWTEGLQVLSSAHEVKMSHAEACTLLSTSEDSEFDAMLRELSFLGVPHPMITDSANGTYTLSPDDAVVHVPAIPVKYVIDPIGAGDAFSGAYVTARILGYQTVTAMKLASIIAAHTCEVVGYLCLNDLSTRQIERSMRKHYADDYYGTFFTLPRTCRSC